MAAVHEELAVTEPLDTKWPRSAPPPAKPFVRASTRGSAGSSEIETTSSARYWYLAAAGNAGEKRVEKTVNRSGSRDFWLMAHKSLLPQETCNYVPQFIAAALIARNPQKYGFENISYQKPQGYDQVKIPGGTDLRWFADSLDIAYEELRELNPELKQTSIPLDQTRYTLKVPVYKKREAHRLAVLCWQKEGVAPSSQRPGP